MHQERRVRYCIQKHSVTIPGHSTLDKAIAFKTQMPSAPFGCVYLQRAVLQRFKELLQLRIREIMMPAFASDSLSSDKSSANLKFFILTQ